MILLAFMNVMAYILFKKCFKRQQTTSHWILWKNKELNVTKNCTNERTKRIIISTIRKNENEAKRNDGFECRKCKEACIEINEKMSKN
jgi:hypothetical protein